MARCSSSRPARRRTDLVHRAVDAIGRDRILGVVLNRAATPRTMGTATTTTTTYGPPEAMPGRHDPSPDAARSRGASTGARRARDGAHRLGGRPWRRTCVSASWTWEISALTNAAAEGAAHRRRLPDLPVLRAICTTCGWLPIGASCSSASCRRSASASFILAALYFWFPALVIGRGVFMIAALLVMALVDRLARRLRVAEPPRRAARAAAARRHQRRRRSRWRARLFERRHELGVEIVGFVDPDPAQVGAPVINPGVIGTIEDIPSIVRARGVDRVVVSLADARGKLPMDKLLEMKLDGVSVRPPGVGVRGVHRQDCGRKPAAELADLLAGLPEEPRARRPASG